MNLISEKQINAYIMACYIFQFGFLQPIAGIVNSQWPTAVSTFLLVFASLVNNRFKVKLHVIHIFLVVGVCFLLNSLMFTRNTDITLAIYIEYIVKGFSAVIIASYTVVGKDLYKSFLKLSLFNFFVVALLPFTSYMDLMGYMRFGYAMLPSVLMFFYAFFSERKLRFLWGCLFAISLILTIFYGSRGALLVFTFFVILVFVFSIRIRLKTKSTIILLTSLIVYLCYQFNLLSRLLDYIYYDLGVTTYALEKFRMQLTQGLVASSSGRGMIYEKIIALSKMNMFIGNGIGIIQLELGLTAHNIFLQILVEAGICGLVLWLLIWIILGVKYIRFSKLNDDGLFKITTVILASAFGRLFVSSDMWLRPEYWFVISLIMGSTVCNSESLETVQASIHDCNSYS